MTPGRKARRTQAAERAAAERAFIQACDTRDTKAIAAAQIRMAIATPGWIDNVRQALRLIPFIEDHAEELIASPPSDRRHMLWVAWYRLEGAQHLEDDEVRDFAIDAVTRALEDLECSRRSKT